MTQRKKLWWLKAVETGSHEVIFYILCNKLLCFGWHFYTLYVLDKHIGMANIKQLYTLSGIN
jgi:hypothetical protein